jgi:hypothetical protein
MCAAWFFLQERICGVAHPNRFELADLTFNQDDGTGALTERTDVSISTDLVVSGTCFPSTIASADVTVTFSSPAAALLAKAKSITATVTVTAGTWTAVVTVAQMAAAGLTVGTTYRCLVTHTPSQAVTTTTFNAVA